MKLALGTAQFGSSYGIANSTGQVFTHEAAKILRLARSAGITTLDTAASYGDSEKCLGKIGVSGWRVITKLPSLPDHVSDVSKWLHAQVNASMSNMRLSCVDGLLLHRPLELLGANGKEYLSALHKIKESGLVSSIGISIYAPEELDLIFPLFKPDIIQAPFNVFDRRLLTSGWLARLEKEKVRVHLRSVFLQGLLLTWEEHLNPYFQPWAKTLENWRVWCAEKSHTPLEASLGFVLAQSNVERVIVGVDSIAQFREILLVRPLEDTQDMNFLSKDLDLIEPRRWNLIKKK